MDKLSYFFLFWRESKSNSLFRSNFLKIKNPPPPDYILKFFDASPYDPELVAGLLKFFFFKSQRVGTQFPWKINEKNVAIKKMENILVLS